MFDMKTLAERENAVPAGDRDLFGLIDTLDEQGRQNARNIALALIDIAGDMLVRLREIETPEAPSAAEIIEEPMDEAEKAALRERCEALAAEYPVDDLPETDAGLIEAERRLHELIPRYHALHDEFEAIVTITFKVEEEIISPTLIAAEVALENFIDEVEPETLIGCAVKLRQMADPCRPRCVEDCPVAQVLAVVERECIA